MSANITNKVWKVGKTCQQPTEYLAPDLQEELGKRLAAEMAIDEFVSNGIVLGVGSGSTIEYAIGRLAKRVKEEKLDITCVPTSFQAKHLIHEFGLKYADLNMCPEVDVAIDGADECDKDLNLIKGGGACQTLEKLVAANAKLLIIIGDYRKDSTTLGEKWKKGIPLEVLPHGYIAVQKKLVEIGGVPLLRMAKNEAGIVKAGPVITDNGNFIIDCHFDDMKAPAELNAKLRNIVGIIETGLFVGFPVKAFFGKSDGVVYTRKNEIFIQVVKDTKI